MLAELDDCRIWYETRGAGKPLVLIHGFGSDHKSWDGIFDTLSERHLVLRYDLRGFGASVDRSNARFSHAADLGALLDRLDIERCDILGCSMGGAIAVNFALSCAERVDRLVLESPALVGWEWTPAWRHLWHEAVHAARAGDIDKARELWWSHPLFETTRAKPAAARKLRAIIDAYSGVHWIEGDRQERVMTPDIERLHHLAAPVLLMTGERDFEDFRVIGDVLTASVPTIRRIDFVGAGHLLHLEEPERVLTEAVAFLG